MKRTTFKKETATHELRWRRERFVESLEGGLVRTRTQDTLQQKWEVTTGHGGSVTYAEEWRDVPTVDEV